MEQLSATEKRLAEIRVRQQEDEVCQREDQRHGGGSHRHTPLVPGEDADVVFTEKPASPGADSERDVDRRASW